MACQWANVVRGETRKKLSCCMRKASVRKRCKLLRQSKRIDIPLLHYHFRWRKLYHIYVKTIIVYEVGIEQTCTETCTNPVDEDVMTITIMYIGQCCSSVRVNIYIWCVDMNIVVALLESKATGRFCLSTTNHRLSLDDAGHRHLSRNVEEIRQETLAAATTCCTKSAHKRYGNEIQAPLG